MKNSQNPVARKTGLVIQDVPGEVLVYDTNTNRAHCLNTSAALVWQSCDGTRSVPEIAAHVTGLSGETVNDDFVWLAIDQLSENDLLESQVDQKFGGISRREVIKRIGLTSMVALPVIASMVAPPTALAASSCACVAPGDCVAQTTCPSINNCNPAGACAP